MITLFLLTYFGISMYLISKVVMNVNEAIDDCCRENKISENKKIISKILFLVIATITMPIIYVFATTNRNQ